MTGKIAKASMWLLHFLIDFLTWPHKATNNEVRGAVGSIVQIVTVFLVANQIWANEPLSLLWVVPVFVLFGGIPYLIGYNMHLTARSPSRNGIRQNSWE